MSTKKLFLFMTLLAVAAAFGATTAQAAPAEKVTICHFPPGNPENVQTITISLNAWPAHELLHGDLFFPCDEDCDEVCDDGNACTQDVDPTAEDCTCIAEPRPPVDCGDTTSCTIDSCDPDIGCVNTPVVCDEEEECQVGACSEEAGGQCVYTQSPDGTECSFGFCQDGFCEVS
jgi:hypothetical protein